MRPAALDILEPMRGHTLFDAARRRVIQVSSTHGPLEAERQARRIVALYEDAAIRQAVHA